MRENWHMHPGFFDKEVCENMIETFKKLPAHDGNVFNTDKEHRKSKVRWVHNQFSLQDALLRKINLANAEMFNVDIQQEMADMQFTEYDAEYEGRYGVHHDVDWQNVRNFDRKLSVVVQLSDPKDYEGGKFEFKEIESPRYDLFAEQGSILIFPSYLQHQVTEVTKGTRYSLVSWVRGPRWR